MERKTESLNRDLNRLKETFSQLSAQITAAGEQFRSAEAPLPENLATDLAEFKIEVGSLGKSVLDVGRIWSLPTALPVGTLAELERSIEVIAALEERRAGTQNKALAALDRVLCIATRDHSAFPPLGQLHGRVRQLRNEITEFPGPELHPGATQLSEGTHGISALLDLIERQNDLTDDRCWSLHEIVGEAFGRDLALAAIRGKLEVQSATPLEIPEAVAVSSAKPSAATPDLPSSVESRFAPVSPRQTSGTPNGSAALATDEMRSRQLAEALYQQLRPAESRRSKTMETPNDFTSSKDSKQKLRATMVLADWPAIPQDELVLAPSGLLGDLDREKPPLVRPDIRPARMLSPNWMMLGGAVLGIALLSYAVARYRLRSEASAASSTPSASPALVSSSAPAPSEAAAATSVEPAPNEQARVNARPPAEKAAVTESNSGERAPQTKPDFAAEQEAIKPAAPAVRLTSKPAPPTQEIAEAKVPPQHSAIQQAPEPPKLTAVPASAARTGVPALGALVTPVVPAPAPSNAALQEPVRIPGASASAKLLSSSRPTYPLSARQARLQGTVRLEAVIGRDGAVQNLSVLSGNSLLALAALEAVKQWRYRPTVLNGSPVAVITNVDVTFRLDQ